ncbi:MAG: threonine--tRNA ligase, partial [Clostridia bacterium]|nr:threonine--tRNA ligase [Clostridia bacterium]
KEVTNKLRANRIRVELDDRNEKIGYKIREAQLQKVPYMLIVGEKEVNSETVGVRSRKDGDVGAIAVDEFIKNIKEEIENFVR